MSNKEARYVVRLGHPHAYKPTDQSALLEHVRTLVEPLGGKAINLRVSRQAVEFDLFCDTTKELHPFLSVLEAIGPTLTYRRLDVPPPSIIPAQVVAEARQLFNDERYWEAHEVLEGLWKKTNGSEKLLIQGLILTAAGLVHVQKNETAVVPSLLEEALRRLQQQPAVYYGLDLQAFLQHLQKLMISKSVYFPSI